MRPGGAPFRHIADLAVREGDVLRNRLHLVLDAAKVAGEARGNSSGHVGCEGLDGALLMPVLCRQGKGKGTNGSHYGEALMVPYASPFNRGAG